ncbi:hypothetical protein CDAR_577681 [Caerostris darwini]|uniref:Uncharacterized protein n=1 Tax=Caerostris darwini TaxID=1538125 RepID=A0AAV4RJ50_9ARAC|nr:hypothetical protein CDAR_577681 [Caerostris darwini]
MTDNILFLADKTTSDRHWVFRHGRNFPSTRQSHTVISDFWSRTRQGKRKEKKTHSLSHTEKSPGRIKPIKKDSIVMLQSSVNISAELTVTNNQQ